jgi:hypothetical protein
MIKERDDAQRRTKSGFPDSYNKQDDEAYACLESCLSDEFDFEAWYSNTGKLKSTEKHSLIDGPRLLLFAVNCCDLVRKTSTKKPEEAAVSLQFTTIQRYKKSHSQDDEGMK